MTDRILVVDDEPDITASIGYHLTRLGYRVSTASTGPEAVQRAIDERPDLLVLDVMLPGLSGFEVLAALRERIEIAGVGVILLTARDGSADRVKGLSLGADDYVTKPFSLEELALRVAAVLRRLNSPSAGSSTRRDVDSLSIDRSSHTVTVAGRHVPLTPTEFKLLLTLVERRGVVQSRARLLRDVWHANPAIHSRTVDMHVQRLRSKLGTAASFVETVRGVGYRFRGESAEPPEGP